MRRILRLTVRHLPFLVGIAALVLTLLGTRVSARSEGRLLQERVRTEQQRLLEERTTAILVAQFSGAALPEDNAAWLINRSKHTSRPVGKPDLEPPLFNLAEGAHGSGNFFCRLAPASSSLMC